MAEGVAVAYNRFAPIYDRFTYRNDYERWIGTLLPELERWDLRHGRLLDVGCGTGRAFEPMLRRGWEIVGCDISSGMLEEARRKIGDRVPLHLADARDLPVLGEFELAWALNDVANYQVGDGELESMLVGMRANLAPGGLIVFDANTFGLFQTHFSDSGEHGMSVGEWSWRGLAAEVEPEGVYESQLSGGNLEAHIHRERHYPERVVRETMAAAGLECLVSFGQSETETEILLTDPPDEGRDYKMLFVGRAV